MSENIDLSKIGYQAYGDSVNWQNYQDKPMPTWEELPENIKTHWKAAAKAISLHCLIAFARWKESNSSKEAE